MSSEARLMLDKEKINHLAFGLLYIGNCTAMHIFILRTVIANSKIANNIVLLSVSHSNADALVATIEQL